MIKPSRTVAGIAKCLKFGGFWGSSANFRLKICDFDSIWCDYAKNSYGRLKYLRLLPFYSFFIENLRYKLKISRMVFESLAPDPSIDWINSLETCQALSIPVSSLNELPLSFLQTKIYFFSKENLPVKTKKNANSIKVSLLLALG